MPTFTGNASGNTARADNGTLAGFLGGTVAELQDGVGDIFNADAGNDVIIAGNGVDTINGDAGDDSLGGSNGADTINGGAGFDEARYDRDNAMDGGTTNGDSFVVVNLSGGSVTHGGFTVNSGQARDGFGATDTLVSIEQIRGTQAGDFLIGGATANGTNAASPFFGQGFEGFRGLGGADYIDGGQGFDEVRHDQDSNNGGALGVIVNLGSTTYTTSGLEAGWTAGTSVIAGAARDGFAATDTLVSIEGARGTAQSDILFGGNTQDDIAERQFTGLAGADTIIGGMGFDSVRYDVDTNFGGAAGVTVNLQTGTATDGFGNTDTLTRIESVLGTSQVDTITGRDYVGFFFDSFVGYAGADVINGGLGNDEVRYNQDVNLGGTGGAVINLSAGVVNVGGTDYASNTARDGFGTIDVLTSIESARGTAAVDYFFGSSGNNNFVGFAGADVIDGGDGSDGVRYDNDAIAGGTAGVTVNLILGTATDGFGTIDTLTSIENARGTAQADTLIGNAENNVMMGLAGADNLVGGAGDRDEIRYDVDWYRGGLGAISVDFVNGTATDGFGNVDTISGFEIVRGTYFADTFTGSGADEVFRANAGNDIINGGGGSDTVSFSRDFGAALEGDVLSRVAVNLSSSTIVAFGNNVASNTTHDSFGGTDTLTSIENAAGGRLADVLVGSAGANVFHGFEGNDFIDGGAGIDTVAYNDDAAIGGITFTNGSNGVYVDLGINGADDGFGDTDTLIGIENVIGTSVSDTIIGNASDNVIDGGPGADTVNGAGGNDTIDYHRMTGPVGVSVDLSANNSWDGVAMDVLTSIENAIGSNATDTLVGNAGANIFEGLGGVDFIQGGLGSDTASYRSNAVGVQVDLNAQFAWDGGSMDFLTSIENAIGSAQTDTLVGNAGDNILEGLGGVDFINGGAGGTDSASYRSATVGVYVDLASQFSWDGAAMDFFTSIEGAIGSAQTDTMLGSAGNDVFEGLGGVDFINGGASGSDTASYRTSTTGVQVDLAAQYSWDGSATDFFTSIENAVGSGFADNLFGSSGVNVFEGLAGSDIMTGNGGNDFFRFAAAGTGTDTITDFDSDATGGQDLIDVSGRGFSAASIGGAIVISGNSGATLITIGADTITLIGVNVATVTAADFIF